MPGKAKSGIETVRRVVHISSNIGQGCAHCEDLVDAIKDWPGAVHHYIERHGYRLLHVGAETHPDGPHGEPCFYTVAVLGSDDPPPLRPAVRPTIVRWQGEKE